jgi:drug/metabolite transporter (DMT)-like permease
VERARHNMTIALGAALALLGVAMVVATLAHGGGALTIGILVGVAFTILGCARVYLAVGPRSQRRS